MTQFFTVLAADLKTLIDTTFHIKNEEQQNKYIKVLGTV